MNCDFTRLMSQYSDVILYVTIGLFIFFWGIIGLCIGLYRGRGFTGFVWGLILGPLGCLIACHLPDANRKKLEQCIEMLTNATVACNQRLETLDGNMKACNARLVDLEKRSEESANLLREHNARYIKTMQYVCDRLADMCDHLKVNESTLNGEKMEEVKDSSAAAQAPAETSSKPSPTEQVNN